MRTVGGDWSECNDDASLEIDEYLPASLPLISPLAAGRISRINDERAIDTMTSCGGALRNAGGNSIPIFDSNVR